VGKKQIDSILVLDDSQDENKKAGTKTGLNDNE
jgi:hypothetical protein